MAANRRMIHLGVTARHDLQVSVNLHTVQGYLIYADTAVEFAPSLIGAYGNFFYSRSIR
jgi:hypothetical protein